MRIHLDTDLGGDPDDVCALALLLGRPDVELVGITTTIDPGGFRAACVLNCLALAGREGIPVVAGAEVSATGVVAEPYYEYWPDTLRARPARAGDALDLLEQSIADGATLVGIGPSTNLAQLEARRPGSLERVPVVLMGGWLEPAAEGLPQWGPEADWNMQWDPHSAAVVARAAMDLTLATHPVTLGAQLRASELPHVRRSGPLGELMAVQSARHADDQGLHRLAASHAGLPDDFLNFHYDPVTCALAAGWNGARVEELPLAHSLHGETFTWRVDPRGRPTWVLRAFDGGRFAAHLATSGRGRPRWPGRSHPRAKAVRPRTVVSLRNRSSSRFGRPSMGEGALRVSGTRGSGTRCNRDRTIGQLAG